MVFLSTSINGGENPDRTSDLRCVLKAYRPVSMPYRDGVLTEEQECASVNLIPFSHNLSIFSVRIFEFSLNAEISPYPKSSASMKMTLGFSVFEYAFPHGISKALLRTID